MENYTYILLLFLIHIIIIFFLYILFTVCFYYTFIITLKNIKYGDGDGYESIDINEIVVIEKDKYN